ncbi:uncharacterized protein LOC143586207 [Bidens hawaiensis]|uniref:uncharacterized protein LOC143586207 n=1 Tax=Bidens hawaiensis TaxID=980011 RepID=UPI00404AB28C
MVSLVAPPATATSPDPTSDDLDDANFITINPHNKHKENEKTKTGEFEFLSTTLTSPTTMLSADELFFEGKLLPFGQKQCHEKLMKINLKYEDLNVNVNVAKEVKLEDNNNNININNIIIISNTGNSSSSNSNSNNNNNRMGWFIDEDPSPRPPKCTVLWKELLRLKKHRGSSLLASASTSSSSSSSSSIDEESKKEKVKRVKKGLERTRSAGIKIRPMVNVPVCSQARSNSMPPVYSGRKGMLDR